MRPTVYSSSVSTPAVRSVWIRTSTYGLVLPVSQIAISTVEKANSILNRCLLDGQVLGFPVSLCRSLVSTS